MFLLEYLLIKLLYITCTSIICISDIIKLFYNIYKYTFSLLKLRRVKKEERLVICVKEYDSGKLNNHDQPACILSS